MKDTAAPAAGSRPADQQADSTAKSRRDRDAGAGPRNRELVSLGFTEDECEHHELRESDGTKVRVGKREAEALACSSRLLSLDPLGRRLIYLDDTRTGQLELMIYDIDRQRRSKLMSLHGDTDGFSAGSWSPSARRFAFVNVNQDRYESNTKLFVLTIEGNKLQDKQKMALAVFYECGAACYPESPKFVAETRIQIIEPGEPGEPGETRTVEVR